MTTPDSPVSALLNWIAATPSESRLDMVALTVYPLSQYVKGLDFSTEDGGEAALRAWLTQTADTPIVAASKLRTVVGHLNEFIKDRASAESWALAKQRMVSSAAAIQADETMEASRRDEMLAMAQRVTEGFPARHQAGIELATSWEALRASGLSTTAIKEWEDRLQAADWAPRKPQ